jgi:hypothetical protein
VCGGPFYSASTLAHHELRDLYRQANEWGTSLVEALPPDLRRLTFDDHDAVGDVQ